MNRYELRTINIVEQPNLANPFKRSNEDSLCEYCEPNTKSNVDGRDKIIPLFAKTPCDGLSHHDRCCFPVVFGEEGSNVVGYFVTVEVLNEQFFSSSCQISGPRNLNILFVVIALFPSLFCDDVCLISPLIQPSVISHHLGFKPFHVDANQGVMAPDLRLRFIG